jgi:hypothetical protein
MAQLHPRRLRRPVLAVTAALAMATLASACGSARHAGARDAAAVPAGSTASPADAAGSTDPTGSPIPGDRAGSPLPGNPAACPVGALTAEFRLSGGQAAQQRGAVVLRNHSSGTCSLSGYVDLQLVDGTDDPISTRTVRAPGVTPTVRLGPGQAAWATVT